MPFFEFIHLQNISFRYRSSASFVFQHLNFVFPANQWSCLLGPSGVGKSSLLRIIAGLLQPESGNISPDLSSQISYMGQSDLLMPWLTVLENTLIGYRLRRSKVIENKHKNRAKDLLAQVGLKDVINEKPEHLSGGMKQRVALVRTFIEDRPVVLMDEPFSALDIATRLQLQDLAMQLLRGKTVLMVTHDPYEALRIADKIYMIKGTPASIQETLVLADLPPRDLTQMKCLEQYALLQKQFLNIEENRKVL